MSHILTINVGIGLGSHIATIAVYNAENGTTEVLTDDVGLRVINFMRTDHHATDFYINSLPWNVK